MALDMLCQAMHAWLLGCRCQEALCHIKKSCFSHRGRAVTKKERDVVREKEE